MLLDIIDWDECKRVNPELTKFVAAQRYRARRFVFSDEVTLAMANLVRDYPDTLLNNYQFARAPYETIFIEYDHEMFLDTIGARTSGPADLKSDKSLGYLIHGDQIAFVVQSGYEPQSYIMPNAYTTGMASMPGCVHLWLPRTQKVPHLLGSTYSNPKASLTWDMENDLNGRYHHWIDKRILKTLSRERYVKEILGHSTGDIRNLLMCLLWINQPNLLDFQTMPATRGWHMAKNIAYAAHTVVRLKAGITGRTILRAMVNRDTPRRHEVRGHWRNFEKTSCEHNFPSIPDEDGRYQCRHCPQWRMWVKDFQRGDASKGFVTKEYRV